MNGCHSSHKVLLISGFDPSGEAGLLKDFSTCLSLGVETVSLITALTAQNQNHFLGFESPSLKLLTQTFKSFNLADISAVKIGMLGDLATTQFVIKALKKLKKHKPQLPVIWDPVFSTSSRGALITALAKKEALSHLPDLVSVITPNAVEACDILKIKYQSKLKGEVLAQNLFDFFKQKTAIYLKGGHLQTQTTDWLVTSQKRLKFNGKKYNFSLRGTGCLLASALASGLAHHLDLEEAALEAKGAMAAFYKLNA